MVVGDVLDRDRAAPAPEHRLEGQGAERGVDHEPPSGIELAERFEDRLQRLDVAVQQGPCVDGPLVSRTGLVHRGESTDETMTTAMPPAGEPGKFEAPPGGSS